MVSSWHFDIYIDCVVREVNARMLGRDLSLMSDDGSECNVNRLLFPHDTTLVADSEERLRQLVELFEIASERRKLNKVMKYTSMVCDRRMNVALNGKFFF